MHAWRTGSGFLLTMGCTSSVPNIADIQTNTTGTGTEDTHLNNKSETEDKELNENPKDTNSEKSSNTFEVLPTCDNLDENIQLARKKSSERVSKQHSEEDDRQSCTNYDNELFPLGMENNEDKFSSLKDIVDQVILDNILEDIQKISSDTVNEVVVEENVVPDNVAVEQILESKDDEKEDLEEVDRKEETTEESASPSQSECSRSTRWEALADIAAELPASLAVDPLTGQIYSLTK